jgi:glutamate-5-semialdehyde dehydrogenase
MAGMFPLSSEYVFMVANRLLLKCFRRANIVAWQNSPRRLGSTCSDSGVVSLGFKMPNENQPNSIQATMNRLGTSARVASRVLATTSNERKSSALRAAAGRLAASVDQILAANKKDLANGCQKGLNASMLDRLKLDQERLDGMIDGVNMIAGMPDPVGKVISEWDRPNGLEIQRVSTPLGVIAVVYESRPNVTADAGALCLKSGNAVILRGGSDSFFSSTAICNAIQDGIESAGLPRTAVQLVPTVNRDAVGMILAGLDDCVDVVVPRGGRGLVERVQAESRVPVFAHLEGICHVYLHQRADLKMAREIVLNSKMRRTGICGAMETLLIDAAWPESHVTEVLTSLMEAGCEIRGDEKICQLLPAAIPAEQADWITEYLAATLSVKIVDCLDRAIEHINHFGSHHTESIVTDCQASAERFLAGIDSAILLHNASTQFADGGEFGMGAEIGIATGKMHARGPVGVEQLTSFNYRVRGNGQTRT